MPWYEKLLLALLLLTIPLGAVGCLLAAKDFPTSGLLLARSVVYTLGAVFALTAALIAVHFRGRGGVSRVVARIFGFLGLLLLIGPAAIAWLYAMIGPDSLLLLLGVAFLLFWMALGAWLLLRGLRLRRPAVAGAACTVEVQAMCESIERSRLRINAWSDDYLNWMDHAEAFRPVWSYTYQGVGYAVAPDHYNGKLKLAIGETRQLLIDPEHPESFFDPQDTAARAFIALGVSFLIVALVCACIFSLIWG